MYPSWNAELSPTAAATRVGACGRPRGCVSQRMARDVVHQLARVNENWFRSITAAFRHAPRDVTGPVVGPAKSRRHEEAATPAWSQNDADRHAPRHGTPAQQAAATLAPVLERPLRHGAGLSAAVCGPGLRWPGRALRTSRSCSSYYTIGESFFAVDAGKVYVCQNNISGTLEVHTHQGMQRRAPFFSKLTAYDKLVSIDTFRNEDDGGKPVRCTFADTYAGTVPVTFRFRMPSSEQEIRKLHIHHCYE